MQRILSTAAARPRRRDRHDRRLGPPPPAAQVGRVPDRARRRRPGPGRGHRPGVRAAAGGADRGDRRRGRPARSPRTPRRPAGSSSPTRRYGRSARPPSRRRSTSTGPTLTATLPTLLDHAAVALRHPRRRRRCAIVGRRGRRVPGRARRARLRRDPHAEDRRRRPPRAGANVFALDYFGRPAYLAQSPQFYKQMMVGVFERVYEVGPVFRAEPHDTARHLAQYTSLDAELGFIDDHRDVMAVLRDALAGMLGDGRRPRPASWRARRDAAGGAGGDPGGALRRRAEMIAGRGPAGRARPRPGPRAVAGGVGACASTARTSSSSPATRWRKRPFYTHPDPARPGVLQRLRPALPRAGAGHRRAAAAPLRRLPGGAGRAGRAGRAVRGLPGRVPARHAAARRLRHRAGAVRGPADRRGQRPRGHRCSRATCTG